jgi:hypothetical protein
MISLLQLLGGDFDFDAMCATAPPRTKSPHPPQHVEHRRQHRSIARSSTHALANARR